MRPIPTLALLAACSSPPLRAGRQALVDTTATFMHTGFGPGPALFTGPGGHLVEERRYEPFGIPLDGADLVARDLNSLNKRTDPATGWSDHGARWMAPEIARWLSTDPPVEAPDASFMLRPWALAPYQYVAQNPIAFWDPDGRDETDVCELEDEADQPRIPAIPAPQTFPAASHGESSELHPVIETAVKPLVELKAAQTVHHLEQVGNTAMAAKLEKAGGWLNGVFGVYHIVQTFRADTAHERIVHIGGTGLAVASILQPEAAPAIAGAEAAFGDDFDYAAGVIGLAPSGLTPERMELMQQAIDHAQHEADQRVFVYGVARAATQMNRDWAFYSQQWDWYGTATTCSEPTACQLGDAVESQ